MKRMMRTLCGIATAFVALLAVVPVHAAAMEVTSVQFPENKSITLDLQPGNGAPNAQMWAKVNFSKGQARIELNYDSMKPAILFGEDVTCYVLWALTRDGNAENLGEVLASSPSNKLVFRSGKKSFAMVVTAESYYLANNPSELVMFANTAPKKDKAPSTVFTFSKFARAPARAMDSIAEIEWDSKQPLELLQARKSYELAGRNQAKTYARAIYAEAGESMDETNALAKKKPKSKDFKDAARATIELSSEAINLSQRRIAGMEIMALIDARRAQVAELEAAVAELNAQKARLERERVALASKTTQIEQTNADLSGMLGFALSKVSEARNTARGYVVNLPDILFEVNKASLRKEAEVPLAKMSGILLIMQGLGVTIEGHTDSTGTDEINTRLSMERAQAILDILVEQGIAADRITAVGLGSAGPIGDNSTAEGRRKNRRVEIILTQTR